MKQSRDFSNELYFDCRRYIKPGDMIWYESMFACPTADKVTRHDAIPHCALVVAVYEAFVVVKLRKVLECANRWDIISVNGKNLKRKETGCFEVPGVPV